MGIEELNWKKATIASAAVVLVLLTLWAFYVPPDWGNNDPVQITVEQGEGISQIAASLKLAGLVRTQTGFVLYVKVLGRESDLKAGTYMLSRGMSVHQIADAIADGRSVPTDVVVLVPEGLNIWEIDKRLFTAGLIKEGELAKRYPHKEGHLFPDTYRFAPDASLEQIVDVMERNFLTKAAIRSDITLITASMLEKEARLAEDMALIAGIMEKRMELGMPLQIDATVGYGWCLKRFAQTGRNCDVTRAPIADEIKIDGPYNTYRRTGWPQGAISNPGIKALTAASHPVKSDYLYYLSTKDGTRIIYSKTHEEHLRNRAKYLGL